MLPRSFISRSLERMIGEYNGQWVEDGDRFDRVVWGIRKGQGIQSNHLSAVDLEGHPDLRALHVGDTDYWAHRLAEDYGYDEDAAQVINVRGRRGDILVEDVQYNTDPDTGIKADSNILVTSRKVLRYGVDWVFDGERFHTEGPAPVVLPLSPELRAIDEQMARMNYKDPRWESLAQRESELRKEHHQRERAESERRAQQHRRR